MKKSYLAMFSLTLCIIALSVFAHRTWARPRRNVGIVNALKGKVLRFHKGETEPNTLESGSKIYLNDRIITAKSSKVQLIFRDDSVLTLGPESELIVEAESFSRVTGKRNSKFALLKGKVRSVVGKSFSKKGSKFEIHTQTAVAGVRGTQNIVEFVQDPPHTNVFSIVNTTYTKGKTGKDEKELLLPPGKGANVPKGKKGKSFEFNFQDPEFLKLMDLTSIHGSDDVENDIEMGSLKRGPMGTNRGDGFHLDEHGLKESPFEYDRDPDKEPEPEKEHEYHGYEGEDYGFSTEGQ